MPTGIHARMQIRYMLHAYSAYIHACMYSCSDPCARRHANSAQAHTHAIMHAHTHTHMHVHGQHAGMYPCMQLEHLCREHLLLFFVISPNKLPSRAPSACINSILRRIATREKKSERFAGVRNRVMDSNLRRITACKVG